MKKLIILYSKLNIYFKLIPFLFFYSLICIILSENRLVFDENSYVSFSKNLLAGFYSPPYPNYNLWSGPGYPIFLAPFVLFKAPLLILKLLNAVFLYVSLIFSYKLFILYAPRKISFIFTILLGLYFLIYEQIPFILTECLTWLLITFSCYFFLSNYQQKMLSWRMIFIAAISIAYLAMTKVIFGIVIEVMILVSLLTLLNTNIRETAKKSSLIFGFAFIFCLPWLIYTYSITHKTFYWGNSGSMSLYTMSSPYQDELGDWISAPVMSESKNHKNFMDSISTLGSLQKDEAYKVAAIQNIKHYPGKYLFNWVNNIGRLLFSFPQSKAPQAITNYYTIVPNMLVVFFILFSLIIYIINIKKIPQEIIFLFIFILIYLFGSSLVSAYRRMFYVTIPFWFFFILYAFNNFVTIQIRRD